MSISQSLYGVTRLQLTPVQCLPVGGQPTYFRKVQVWLDGAKVEINLMSDTAQQLFLAEEAPHEQA